MAIDRQTLIKVGLAALVVFLVYKYVQYNNRAKQGKPTYDKSEGYVAFDEMPFDTIPPSSGPGAAPAQPMVPPVNVASDLLPKPTQQVADFGEFAPRALDGQNFLNNTQQMGLDTKGSSMKNANLQLRADPPNPRVNVGPWMNSTIEADLLRRPLE